MIHLTIIEKLKDFQMNFPSEFLVLKSNDKLLNKKFKYCNSSYYLVK